MSERLYLDEGIDCRGPLSGPRNDILLDTFNNLFKVFDNCNQTVFSIIFHRDISKGIFVPFRPNSCFRLPLRLPSQDGAAGKKAFG